MPFFELIIPNRLLAPSKNIGGALFTQIALNLIIIWIWLCSCPLAVLSNYRCSLDAFWNKLTDPFYWQYLKKLCCLIKCSLKSTCKCSCLVFPSCQPNLAMFALCYTKCTIIRDYVITFEDWYLLFSIVVLLFSSGYCFPSVLGMKASGK